MRNGDSLTWIWAAVVLVLFLQFIMMTDVMKRFDAIEDGQEGIEDLLQSLGASYSQEYLYRYVDKEIAEREDAAYREAISGLKGEQDKVK